MNIIANLTNYVHVTLKLTISRKSYEHYVSDGLVHVLIYQYFILHYLYYVAVLHTVGALIISS